MRTKQISINQDGSNVIVRQFEDLPDFASLFQGLFEELKNHSDVEKKPNRAYMYCSIREVFEKSGYVKKLDKRSRRISINVEGEIDEMFFDKRHLGISETMYPIFDDIDDTVIIEVNHKFAGYYVPHLNILIATDWTHTYTPVTAKIVKTFISRIKRRYHLSRKTWRPILKPDQEITLGCDPEFELLRDANRYSVIRATDMIDYDDSAELGTDGSGDQVEVRPDPSTSPRGLVENIQKIFKYAQMPLSIRGRIYSLGGHIHIGMPRNNAYRQIVKVLDDFVGSPLRKVEGQAREEVGYSGLGLWRTQPWGIEYRTPPATYLANPEFARITFKIVKATTEFLLKNGIIKYKIDDNGNVSDEDYLRFITVDELHKFKDYTSIYPDQLPLTINAAWEVEDGAKPRLDITFASGDYNIALREYIEKYIRDRVPQSDMRMVFKVRFFGLREDRGNVFFGEGLSPQVEDFSGNKYYQSNEYVWGAIFGLSWYSRYSKDAEARMELNKALDQVVNVIKKYNAKAGE